MHPLLASLTGKSAITNYRDHKRTVKKALAKLEAFWLRASQANDTTAAAYAAFMKAPTEETFAKLVTAEANGPAMFKISQSLSAHVAGARAAKLAEGRGKLLAAVDEVETELNAKRAAIVLEDEKRSAELGEPVSSTAALSKIDQMLASLNDGEGVRSHAEHLFPSAMSKFDTIIGPDPQDA